MTHSMQIGSDPKLEQNKRSIMKKTVQWCIANSRAAWAELISTAFLMFFGCMSCESGDIHTMKTAMYSAWGFGMTVLFNIQVFGHISGAHMNPCVTLAALIWGSISVPLALVYFVAQCIGAILGCYLLSVVTPHDINISLDVCVTVPIESLTVARAIVIEMLLTSALCLLCCGIWDPVNQSKMEPVGLKFGFVVVGLSVVGGPITGASMNPVRSLGPAVVTGIWTMHHVYWLGPILGSVTGTLIYKYTFLRKQS